MGMRRKRREEPVGPRVVMKKKDTDPAVESSAVKHAVPPPGLGPKAAARWLAARRQRLEREAGG